MDDLQQKYDSFLNIYGKGITKWAPLLKVRDEKKNDWFNKRCEMAGNKRDAVWRKMKRRPTQKTIETTIGEE